VPVDVNGDDHVRRRIIAAARERFTKYGPRNTTMEDVAATAGIARTAIYRYVSSRDEIIETVILQRVEELSQGFASVIDGSLPFEDAMVEVVMAAVNAARRDPELQTLFQTTTGTRIVSVMVGPNPAFHEFVKGFFEGAFAAARAAGYMRADVSDDDVVDWIRGVVVMLVLREDLDAERERDMLRKFLLPAVIPREANSVDLTDKPRRPTKRRV
jgi:AcrR family transcriptional regulator